MENVIYHQVQAENQKQFWKENDTIDFILSFENRSLVCNSVRFEGNIRVSSAVADTPLTSAEDVYLDNKIGIHSVIQSSVVQFQNQGVVENLTEMPRFVKQNTEGTKSDNDMNSSDMVSELRSGDKAITKLQIQPQVPKDYGGASGGHITSVPSQYITDPSFSIKPQFCLNKVMGNNINLTYTQSGAIKVSLTLEKNLGVLFGRDVDTNYNYILKNCKMCFMSVPMGKPQPLTMMNTLCLKNSLTSAFSNTSSKVPAICNSVSCSFMRQSHEYSTDFCNTALEQPPNIKSMSYLFNDATNKFISFQIEDRVELYTRGLESLNGNGVNSVNLTKLSANKSCIVGINWEQYIDLSNQKFNIQVNSDINNVESYILFMYFHSVIKV